MAEKTPAAPEPSFFRRYRQELTFLLLFFGLLIGGFTLISLNAVNDGVIEPFTAGIAKVSGLTLKALGQDIRMDGTRILSKRFSVNIKNGCNGVEAMLIFFAAVLAFPSPWASRLKGLALGFVVIQVLNLIRVVALYLTGAYMPKLFDTSHTVVWQGIVILLSLVLWIYWASRFAGGRSSDHAATA